MSKKELGNKAHKLRRIFIIGTIATAVLTLGVGVFAGMAAKPILLAMNACLLAGAVGITVGSGVALNKIYEQIAVKSNETKAAKALEQIKAMDKDNSSEYSQSKRVKVLRKYANANLRLAHFRGATPFGELHSTSGMGKVATELVNKIDAYYILRDSSTSDREAKKYSKKIKLAESRLAKITEGEKSTKFKWTRSYENVVSGVTALDRRTEISCLTSLARDSFRMMMENNTEVVDNQCINLQVTFGNSSAIAPCVARAEDQTKASVIREILIYDIVEACKSKSPLEIKSMFPITIETKHIDKVSTKLIKKDALKISSYAELQALTQKGNTK